MKKLLTLVVLLLCTAFFASCIFDDDEPKWNAAEVCPEIGTNIYGMPNRGTFVDERDGREYKYTTIGNQVWMAENLKYEAPYSECCGYEYSIEKYCSLVELGCDTKECCVQSMCDTFGRYYSIIKDGKQYGLIDRALVDSLCPKGWHIPSKFEWETLDSVVEKNATRLKSRDRILFAASINEMNHYNEIREGTDDCMFSVLPASSLDYDGFASLINASFLSSTQENLLYIWTYFIQQETSFSFQEKGNTIRCLKD